MNGMSEGEGKRDMHCVRFHKEVRISEDMEWWWMEVE